MFRFNFSFGFKLTAQQVRGVLVAVAVVCAYLLGHL
jgi:hypothetical protein